MIKEFKDFINRGNLVDIAVAFVLGVAFSSVVTTLTTRIVSPLIGLIFDLRSLESVWTFGDIDPETGVPAGSVGAFIEASINFVIVAFVMFLVVKAYNRMKESMTQPSEDIAEEPAQSDEVKLLTEIRDHLAR